MIDTILEWIFDRFYRVALIAIAAFIPLAYWAYKAEQKQIAECVKQDGKWVTVGSHQYTYYIQSGNVLVPITSTVNDYGCIK